MEESKHFEDDILPSTDVVSVSSTGTVTVESGTAAPVTSAVSASYVLPTKFTPLEECLYTFPLPPDAFDSVLKQEVGGMNIELTDGTVIKSFPLVIANLIVSLRNFLIIDDDGGLSLEDPDTIYPIVNDEITPRLFMQMWYFMTNLLKDPIKGLRRPLEYTDDFRNKETDPDGRLYKFSPVVMLSHPEVGFPGWADDLARSMTIGELYYLMRFADSVSDPEPVEAAPVAAVGKVTGTGDDDYMEVEGPSDPPTSINSLYQMCVFMIARFLLSYNIEDDPLFTVSPPAVIVDVLKAYPNLRGTDHSMGVPPPRIYIAPVTQEVAERNLAKLRELGSNASYELLAEHLEGFNNPLDDEPYIDYPGIRGSDGKPLGWRVSKQIVDDLLVFVNSPGVAKDPSNPCTLPNNLISILLARGIFDSRVPESELEKIESD